MSLDPGQRVRYWRELKGLTQVQLADRAGMRNSKVCRIESGENESRTKDIERLAAAMDLTMVQFYGGAEDTTVASHFETAEEPKVGVA